MTIIEVLDVCEMEDYRIREYDLAPDRAVCISPELWQAPLCYEPNVW